MSVIVVIPLCTSPLKICEFASPLIGISKPDCYFARILANGVLTVLANHSEHCVLLLNLPMSIQFPVAGETNERRQKNILFCHILVSGGIL